MSQHAGRRGLLTAVALAIAAIAWLAAQPATSSGHPGHRHADAPLSRAQAHDLRRARAATRKFRDVKLARAAGYAATGECARDPKDGGMGVHYANPDLVADGKLDVTKPEVLVYQPKPNGKLRLGALEYLQADADQDLATDDDRPSLFDLPFDGPMLGHEPGTPIHYDLHVWLYPPQPRRPVRGLEPPRALPRRGTARQPLTQSDSVTIHTTRLQPAIGIAIAVADKGSTWARPATADRVRSSATSRSDIGTSASRS